jgi:hypothetical protein
MEPRRGVRVCPVLSAAPRSPNRRGNDCAWCMVYRAQNVRFWRMVLLQRARAYPGTARAVITPRHDQNLRAL